MVQDIERRVAALVNEKLADREDLFIVRVKMHPNKILEILLDGDHGVDIDVCAQVSRHVGYHLEEENAIDSAYRLEVSSPGIDAVFSDIRQYRKNIGRQVEVKLLDADKSKIEGTLIAVEESGIKVSQKRKEKGKKIQEVEVIIPFDQIKATKVVISF